MLLSHKAGSALSECVFRDTTGILTKFRLGLRDDLVETYTLLRSLLSDADFNFGTFIKDLETYLELDQEDAVESRDLMEDSPV